LITFLGIDPRRFKISWVSAAEGAKWSTLVKEITAEVKALGPFETYSKILTGEPGR
jgi:coenzyme F420-reducing hydrogenase delta subunit